MTWQDLGVRSNFPAVAGTVERFEAEMLSQSGLQCVGRGQPKQQGGVLQFMPLCDQCLSQGEGFPRTLRPRDDIIRLKDLRKAQLAKWVNGGHDAITLGKGGAVSSQDANAGVCRRAPARHGHAPHA